MSQRNDVATVWKKGAIDMYGAPTWGTPTQIMVRWEEGERRYITEDGTEARGRNSIMFDGDGVLEIGDYIFRGASTATSPPTKSWEIKQTYRVPNLSGTKVFYEAVA